MDAGSAIFCPVVADQSISRWAVLGREVVVPALWGGGPSTSWSGAGQGRGPVWGQGRSGGRVHVIRVFHIYQISYLVLILCGG